MSDNEYLQQVMAQQERVALDLKANHRSRVVFDSEPVAAALASPGDLAPPPPLRKRRFEVASPPSPPSPVETRITGFWRWKTVIVPPNAHVVHTRRGRPKPLHIGLGTSFRYNPATDAFLVVPGTMQTILINAQCICRELQGLVVQGYVQWIVDDFATAYQKLDFSDTDDPMRVVNVQLREQAEAAIKDKVATMSIDDVLSDKQPIIEELTARLRAVAEGIEDADAGLGLRIVTVQIKEAVVASRQVWETLQQPFRAERSRIARLADLEASAAIARDDADRRHAAAVHTAELDRARLAADADLDQARLARTAELDQARLAHDAELDQARLAHDAELAARKAIAGRQATEHQLALDELHAAAAERRTEAELRELEARQRIANAISDGALRAQLIAALPDIADKLPKPTELRTISLGGDASLSSMLGQLLAVLDRVRPSASDR